MYQTSQQSIGSPDSAEELPCDAFFNNVGVIVQLVHDGQEQHGAVQQRLMDHEQIDRLLTKLLTAQQHEDGQNIPGNTKGTYTDVDIVVREWLPWINFHGRLSRESVIAAVTVTFHRLECPEITISDIIMYIASFLKYNKYTYNSHYCYCPRYQAIIL